MVDLVLPPALNQARVGFKYLDSTGVTRGVYTGVPQTTNYGGDRIGAAIEFSPAGGRAASSAEQSRRGQLLAFLMSLRGRTNRCYLTDASYTPRGSFPAVELFTNADFMSGTGSWSQTNAGTLGAAEGVMRLSAPRGGAQPDIFQSVTMTQYAAYATRALIRDGSATSGLSLGQQITQTGGSTFINTFTDRGYKVVSGVNLTSGAENIFPAFYNANTGYMAGAYFDLLFTSASRSLLVDGRSNLLLRSDEIENAAWVRSGLSSIGTNTNGAPDGTATAEAIFENSSNVEHYVAQTVASGIVSGIAEYCFGICVKADNRSWCALFMTENTGGTQVGQFFNAATGAIGATGSTGANWGNRRTFSVALGNGWYYFAVVGRKTNAATSISCNLYCATADGTSTYLGTGVSSIIAWRGSLSQSSAPTRLVQTTSVAQAAQTQSGTSIYVKAGRTPSEGALAAALTLGDQVEIDGQVKFVTAPLDLDASGQGHLQFSPPLRRAVADNTPIIICKPMGRFMLAGEDSGFATEPGIFSNASIELEEAFG